MNNYSSWQIKILTQKQFKALDHISKAKYLTHFGHLASSTHNTQPWAFHLNSDSIEVFLDNDRVLPASDIVGRQACVSVGCAIGNIILAAQQYGYFSTLKWSKLSDSIPQKRYVSVAKIYLLDKAKDGVNPLDIAVLLSRSVERARYDTLKDFPKKFYKEFENIFNDSKEIGYRIWRRGDPRIHLVAELQSQADTYVANNNKFALELSDWILPNDTDSYLGMPGSTFRLSDSQTNDVIKGLKNKSKMQADLLSGFAGTGKKGIESSAFVCMLTISKQNIQNWVSVGMKLANVQFLVEKYKGNIAMHAGLAEVAIVRMSLAAMGMTTSQPVILFRAGFLEPKTIRSPHSPRLPLDQVLI